MTHCIMANVFLKSTLRAGLVKPLTGRSHHKDALARCIHPFTNLAARQLHYNFIATTRPTVGLSSPWIAKPLFSRL